MLFARVCMLRDAAVLDGSRSLAADAAWNLAELLAHLAVIKQRRLFAAAGYPSIYDFCVHELGLSEDATARRLTAARLAADHPQLFEAIADQRLTLSTLLLLSPFVGAVPVGELIDGLAHKTHTASREWLAARFPQSALPTRTEFVNADGSRTPAEPGTTSGDNERDEMGQLATSRVALSETSGSTNSKGPLPRASTIPLSAELVAYQFTVERATHELLLRAQELLGSEVAPGDLAKVFALALKSLVRDREKSRHGLHTESRGVSAAPARGRYIPAQLKAQVYTRDQGQCAFMTDDGLRCECRADLEYDHIVPLAQGGGTVPSRRDTVTHCASEATRDPRTTLQESGGVGPTPERGESEATGPPRGVRSTPPRHEQASATAIVEPGTNQRIALERVYVPCHLAGTARSEGSRNRGGSSNSRAGRTRWGTHP